jgi:hypothetical protein
MVGRNDPCPCGSGKKYKKCCLERDREAPTAEEIAAQRAAAAAGEWQVDILPFPGSLSEEPDARLAVVMVVADGLVLHGEVLDRPSPEVEEMAATLAAGVRATAEALGVAPRRVVAREPEVAAALARLLAGAGRGPAGGAPPEVVAGLLDDLDEAGFAMVSEVGGRPVRFYVSYPETWAAWGLPPELVERLFAAAASFHRAAPWGELGNLDLLEAATLSGGSWSVSVLGEGSEEYGLALYSEVEDLWEMAEWDGGEGTPFDDLAGRVLQLGFEGGRGAPRALRREATAAGWEVAAADAYPRLMAVNTAAGGVRRRDAEDLLALLLAVPAFVAAHGPAVAERREVGDWRDPATGVELTYRPAEGAEGADSVFLPDLAPGSAEGPGADPEAVLGALESAWRDPDAFYENEATVVPRFERFLADRAGLAPSTVRRHVDHVRLFVEFLAGMGVPVRAVHEYDLRVYLYDWFPRKVATSATDAAALPPALKRFVDFLEAVEGIRLPWAREILADRQAFGERWQGSPGGPFWSEGVAEWRLEHDRELFVRLMIPDSALGPERQDRWGSMMGAVEAQLQQEIHRRWLLWRDELLAGPRRELDALAVELVARQHRWEGEPHPRLGGATPLEAIRRERRGARRPRKGERR